MYTGRNLNPKSEKSLLALLKGHQGCKGNQYHQARDKLEYLTDLKSSKRYLYFNKSFGQIKDQKTTRSMPSVYFFHPSINVFLLSEVEDCRGQK